MTSTARVAWVLALLSPAVAARGGDAPPPARDWLPKDALIVVEVERPQALIDLMVGPKMTGMVTKHPAYRAAMDGPQLKGLVQLVNFLEMQTGTTWREGLATLLRGGATMAVLPGDRAVLISDSADPELLRKVHDIFIQATRGEADKQGKPDPVVSREVQGVTTWSLGGAPCYALMDGRFVWGNNPAALESLLERRSHAGRPGLTSSASYKAARKAASPDAVATAYADLSVLKALPQLAEAVKPSENPLAVLLAGGLKEALGRSQWLGLDLRVQGESVTLAAAMDGTAGGSGSRSGFMSPPQGKGALPPVPVPGQLATMSLYRDLFGFYSAKDQLFPERTSGLIFFENMMGIFFSGRDLNGEVLAETRPEVRLVMARQTYDSTVGTPEVKMPAFALLVPAKHPEEFARVAEEAWQKAVGLISVTRGQKAEPGLVIDRVMQGDVKFTVVTNSVGKGEDRAHLPARFNYTPSLAHVGDTFILSSTESLARDLIDALKKAPAANAKPLVGTHTLVEADGVQLAGLVDANRATLVERNMVEKGNSREKAEGEIGTLAGLLRLAKHARLTGSENGPPARYSLTVELNLP